MADISLGIKGIGPKKERTLYESGYHSIDDLREADFYDIVRLPGFGITTAYRMWEALGLEIGYRPMTEVTDTVHKDVVIENKTIRPWAEYCARKKKVPQPAPEDHRVERTTVWSFPERGSWASHNPQYRGNWPPQMVRNILELYSETGDTVLDPMVGGGTTPVECLLMGRNSISVDINPGAICITRDRLDLPDSITDGIMKTEHRTYVGDARRLNAISDGSVDLIATHPPYINIISYAPHIDGDLSQFSDYGIFFKEFSKAIDEMMRVLRPGGFCAILIGDTHNKSHFVPISARMMIEFLSHGFILKEDIIKREWNCGSDHNLGKYEGSDFLLTMHEHLYVFEKPEDGKTVAPNSSFRFFESVL